MNPFCPNLWCLVYVLPEMAHLSSQFKLAALQGLNSHMGLVATVSGHAGSMSIALSNASNQFQPVRKETTHILPMSSPTGASLSLLDYIPLISQDRKAEKSCLLLILQNDFWLLKVLKKFFSIFNVFVNALLLGFLLLFFYFYYSCFRLLG